ncbi:hypothetical protein SELMODRAFT_403720 [Selaginella moellendorffii]|uniref:Uncharacterized protein n=1 Tax=Selaginella moellendorffii TaxID=88036 RepID=D8QSB1_SELML|nr:hypothetical protein SELMODRAFT_403720 [Selaginella moellendorffii]
MALIAAPKFYSIESIAYLGYFITQHGTQIVLKSKDVLIVVQRRVLAVPEQDVTGLLCSQLSSTSRSVVKATVGDYDPVVEDDPLLWSVSASSDDQVSITMTGNSSVFLSHTSSSSSFKDGVPVVTSTHGGNSQWKLVTYAKCGRNFQGCNQAQRRDKRGPNNISLDGMIWYKVPAGGRDDTTYFTVQTGLALKGSTKPGDKVLLTQYDPLDYGFVWSENRFQASNTDYLAINLDGTNLQWALQNDDQYQNSAWYRHLQTKDI